MSIDIDDLLKDCPEYQEWSHAIHRDNLEHYESDPEYFSWVDSVDTEEKKNEEYSILDSFGLLEDDVDWESLFMEWKKIPLSVEEQEFYETYCI